MRLFSVRVNQLIIICSDFAVEFSPRILPFDVVTEFLV